MAWSWQICKQLKIQDLNKCSLTKKEIQQAVEKSRQEDMLSQFEHSSKLQDIKNCDFSTYQTYFNDKSIENARTKFKIRSKMQIMTVSFALILVLLRKSKNACKHV